MAGLWLDGIDRGWSIPAALLIFIAAWMLILQLAYLNAGLHPDVIETWSIGRSLDWGNDKHPPLMGWMTHVWCLVFPATDWSMQLLAMVNAALGLWFVDRIAKRFVSGDKRAVVLLLAMLLPAYHFHAQRFNANTVLLATWPLAIYCFLRSFETRTLLWSVAAGAAAALAMLGKYYSVFLIIGFVVAAIAHPDRRRYLLSFAPWISAITGLILLAPHVYSVVANDFLTLTYPFRKHGGVALVDVAWKVVKFLAGIAGWLAVPALVFGWIAGEPRARFIAPLRHLNGGLLLLALIFGVSTLLPCVVVFASRTNLPSLWTLQALFLAILIVVGQPTVTITRRSTVQLASGIVIATLALVVLAPLHSVYRNEQPFNEHRTFYRQTTDELARLWRAEGDSRLEQVTGNEDLAGAVEFYNPIHPKVLALSLDEAGRVIVPANLRKNGWAAVCIEPDTVCGQLERHAIESGQAPLSKHLELQSRFLGRSGASLRVFVLTVPHRVQPNHHQTEEIWISAPASAGPTIPIGDLVTPGPTGP